jgi:hypothetical protein
MKSKTPGKEHRKRLKQVEESLETYLSNLGVDDKPEDSLPRLSPEEFQKMRDRLNAPDSPDTEPSKNTTDSDSSEQELFVSELKVSLTETQEDLLISLRRSLIKGRSNPQKGSLLEDADIIRALIELIPELKLEPRDIYSAQDLRTLVHEALKRRCRS